MDYEYTTYKNLNVLSSKVNSSNIKNVNRVIQELKENDMQCNKTDYVIICHKYSVFWIFLYICYTVLPGNGKVLLLLNNNYLNFMVDNKYLCKENTAVVMTKYSLPPNGIRHESLQNDQYSTRFVENIIQILQ